MAEPLEEGTIVEIPYGMKLVRKGGQRIPRITKKKYVADFEEVSSDYEGENFDEDDGEGEIDYDEDEGMGDETDMEEGEREEGDIEEGDIEGGDEDKIPKYEVGEEFIWKKISIYQTTTAEDAASRLGLPTKHEKLIPIKVKRRVYKNILTYAGKLRMKVGPRGKLLPIESPNRGIKIMEDVPINYATTPPSYQPKKSSISPNPFDPNFNLYDYVSFSRFSEDIGNDSNVEGIIMTTTNTGVGIKIMRSTVADMKIGDYYFVKYDDSSLKKQKPPVVDIIKSDITTPEDIFMEATVPDQLRNLIIGMYIRILNDMRTTETKEIFETMDPVIDTEILNNKPIPFDDYYAENFYRWIGVKHHQKFVDAVDKDELAKWAERIYADEINPDNLIKEIGNISYDTDVDDLLTRFKKLKEITLFQGMLIQEFEKEKYSGRSNTKGKDLAIIISTTIEKYYRLHPPNVDYHLQNFIAAAIEREHSSYIPTDIDREEFKLIHLETLEKLHSEAMKRYNEEKLKIETIKSKPLLSVKPIKIIDIKEDNEYRVKNYERIIFATHGSSVYDYMTNVMIPHIFMEGKLGSFAKFFRSKLADGKFQFDALTGANIAHYLPELVMNKELTDKEWMISGSAIGIILYQDVIRMIDFYINVLHPTDKIYISGYNDVTMRSNINLIEDMLINPIKVCKDDSNTGTRLMVKDGEYVLSEIGQKIPEDIPESDLVICYDEGKFTCHSTRDVVTRISKGDLVNPHTQKKYPANFIEKMKERYDLNPIIYQEPATPKFEKPTPQKSPSKIIKPIIKPSRPHHKPPKDIKPEKIKGMILYGDELEFISLFATTFDVKLKDGSSRSIPITFDKKNTKSNVGVLSFDVTQPKTISGLSFRLKQIPKNITKIYVIGLNSAQISANDKNIFKHRIKKIIPKVKDIFYSITESEEDIIYALTDIVIDMEGVDVS